MTNQPLEPECCPEFNPAAWDNQVIEWDQKRFIKGRVCTFMFMPLNFGGAMRKMNALAGKAGADIPDWLCLSDHTSKWNMDIYLAVDEAIPGEDNATLTGEFYSKVYEGSFKDTGKWCEDFKSIVKSKNKSIEKLYMWYTTCPKCAKKYGKNYVVILGKMN